MVEGLRIHLAGHIVVHHHAHGDHAWLELQRGYRDNPDRPISGLFLEEQPTMRFDCQAPGGSTRPTSNARNATASRESTPSFSMMVDK